MFAFWDKPIIHVSADLMIHRNMFWTLTFQNDEQVIRKMVELHDELSEKLYNASSTFAISNMIQPVPTLFSNHSIDRGGNVLGLDRFKENLVCESSGGV